MTNDSESAEVIGSAEVAARFTLNLAIFLAIAGDPSLDFGRTFATLSLMWAALCVFTGLVRREHPFDKKLTHWHEAAVYGLLCGLITAAGGTAII